jgi:hypothetical protein
MQALSKKTKFARLKKATQSRCLVNPPKLYDFDTFSAMLSILDVGGVLLFKENELSMRNGLESDWERLSNDWLTLTKDYRRLNDKINDGNDVTI